MVDRSQEMLLEDAGNLLGPQEGPSDLYLSGNNTPRRLRFQAVAAAYGIQHILLDMLFGPLHGEGQDLIPIPMAARGVLGRILARRRGSTVDEARIWKSPLRVSASTIDSSGTRQASCALRRVTTGQRRGGLPARRNLRAACADEHGYCENSRHPHKATESLKTGSHGGSGRGETGALRTGSPGPASHSITCLRDSRVTLAWVRSAANRWKPFV
ncbi:conserved hypothetical protein [Trichinella spiralis]|uniref:hypothetical protein n=1 Tax=Trichinella spiralis TaxID=6334 RepID=UPI0001EFE1E4|nr:conserved hypothetical protein [Trichinella spiralis]